VDGVGGKIMIKMILATLLGLCAILAMCSSVWESYNVTIISDGAKRRVVLGLEVM
jgi:hypothetical protein